MATLSNIRMGVSSLYPYLEVGPRWCREEEDLSSWVGRVRGGWAEQLQVLRSAPLMMMMMDAEEDLKTKWKKRWREAITGDGEMRIRDHMDDREVQKRVKLVDTASFTVINLTSHSWVRIIELF